MVIAHTDLEEIFRIAQQQGEDVFRRTDLWEEYRLPQRLGVGRACSNFLRNGLTVYIRNAKLKQAIRIDHQHVSNFPLVAKFYVSGFSRVQTKGPTLTHVKASYVEKPGCHYLYHLPNIAEIEEWPSNELFQVVYILVRPDYLPTLGLDEILPPSPLKQLLDGDVTQQFHQSLGQITPAMGQVLQQILQAPYQGAIQQLYLESKALELLALQFAHWAEAVPSGQARAFSADLLDRLYAAKEILTQDVSKPPVLTDLAQRVGLNEYRLKQGFRQAFGTTPFGYLHHYRMQHAQYLLLNSGLTIAGVAARIGYRNPEAFSTAFRRKFAISPKAYQLRRRS
ncbi:MAG: AraC family transcriptional regulator [Cyanobacteria bacterium P01_D01_bin.56]